MRVLVTGAAGFIGFHLSKELIKKGFSVVGLDNINSYYDPELKYGRLKELGINKERVSRGNQINSEKYDNFEFVQQDLENKDELFSLFQENMFDIVVNLAAQAGVRYSIDNPDTYIQSNIVGFFNVLEACRQFSVNRLLYASSSSVYGKNESIPFSVNDKVDSPVSLYAASKKSNELMAHAYSHLFGITTVGLRFFTVYGAWGRPDMAYFLFTKAIISGEPINVYNFGKMERDFTHIDDIIRGVVSVINSIKDNNQTAHKNVVPLSKVYNIGNATPVNLLDFIEELEKGLKEKALKNFMPIQPGDVYRTWADVTPLKLDFNYEPRVKISEGVQSFIQWYRNYYNV